MSKSAEHVTSLENKISLPRPQCDGAVSLEKALLHRRSVRDFSSRRLELWHISQLAWAAQGITGPQRPSDGSLCRRAISSGTLCGCWKRDRSGTGDL